jgi:hypothetical protein
MELLAGRRVVQASGRKLRRHRGRDEEKRDG